MIGFETIGNAVIVCFDGASVLATDPWLSGKDKSGFGISQTIAGARHRMTIRIPNCAG